MKKFDSLKTFSQHVKVLAVMLFACLFSLGANAQVYQYQLVSENQTDWSGTYLLAYTTSSSTVVLSGISTTNTKYGLSTDVTSFAAGNAIASNATTDAYAVTIAPVTDSTYTLYLKDVGYLGWTTTSNTLNPTATLPTSSPDKYYWKISIVNGVLNIINVNSINTNLTNSTKHRYIRYNTSANPKRFATYENAGQQACSLYKYEELTGVPVPTFSVNTGTFYAPQTVTITSNVPGTTIYYTVDGTNPTVSSTQYSEPIAINATTTLKAIAVLGETASNVGTAVYTFPTFTTLDNLAAFKAQTTATTDTFKVNSTMTVIFQTTDKYHTFLQDSSAAIYVYGTMDKAYQPGDVISGGVFGTYSLYKQMNEMKPVSGAPLAAGVHGTAVAPIKVKLADLINNYSQYEGMLVTVEGVQVSSDFTFSTSRSTGVNVSQGENTIQIYNTFKTLDKSLIANSLVNVTGLVIRYNTTIEIAPRSNNDISVPMPSLPYLVDFDENVDTLITIVNGNATNKWFVGQAEGFDNNKLYISSSNGVTNKYDVNQSANVQVYRDVFIPENGATLSFDVRVNGEAGNDMLRVVLYNYTNNILNDTSNWSVGIYDEPEWTNVKTVISPEHAGMARLVFYWTNNSQNGEQYPAAIDNISLTEAACAQPIALNPVVSHDTAVITWNTVDTTQNSWIFEYKLEDHNEWYSINTTTPNITLTGLQGSSNYDVRVKANCGTESSEWTVGQFEVGCLHKGVVQGDTTLTIGTGTSTTNQWLFPGYDGWQYVAELYEMPKAGILNDIAFYLSSNATNSSATMKVWVKAVDANYTLASSNTFNSMLQGATQIFDGNANFTSTGWIHFPIDNGLNMPEGKKLLVLVRGTGCSTSGGCSRYHRYSTASNMVWYKRQDSSDPGQNVSGSLSSNRANIQMTMKIEKTVCNDQLACVAPTAVTVTDITENSAVITWSGNATDYAFEYKTGENDWTVVSVSDTTYTLTGLTQKTDYLVRVKAICGENNYSLYSVEVPFTTTSVCPVVTNITSSNLSTTTTLSWTPGGEENDWNIRFRPMGTTEWIDLPRISGIASTTFGGLNDQTDYEVEIKALCDLENEDNQSSWAHYVFTSGCAPFELTYEEDFNAATSPECWTDNDITFDGTAAVAESAAQWLMTPPIQIPADYNTYVVVDMQGEATLMASYRGTAMDRFTEIAVLANDSTGHYIIEVPAAYKNKAVNFLFLTNDEFSIDNVLFTQCAFVPTDLVAANPLNNSVELSWTGVNNNGWILEYAQAGSEDWTALTLEQTSDTVHYTLTGLEGDQLYKFRVSTICEGGSISKPSNVATIQTRCDAVAVPYKDFTRSQYGNYYNGTLHCWTPFYTGRDSQSGASVSSGQLLLKKYYHVTDAPSGDVFAILPTMDTALNTLQISFNIKTNNGTPNQKVYLCLVTDVNNPADSFKILKDYTATSNEESYFYTLDGVEREGNLAFRMPLEDAHSHEVLINNVVVEVIPPCQAPFNLAANALDENRVQLTWEYVADEGGDNDFTIRYKKMTSPTDFLDPYEGGTEKQGASTPREFNDLEYGATYRFVIRHECGDMHSVWSKEYDYTFVKNYNIAKETNITTCHGTVVYNDTTTAATTKTMVINPSSEGNWVKLTGDVQLDGCTLYVYEGNAVANDKLLKTYTGNVSGIALTPVCENEITLRLVKKANSNPVLNLQIECEAAPTCSAPTQLAYNEVTTALTWTAGCWGAAESYNIQVLNEGEVEVKKLNSTTTTVNIPVDELSNGKYILRVQPVCDNVPGEWSDTISFVRVSCAEPTAFTVDTISTTNGYTAKLTWSGNAALGYEVGYKLHDAYSWATANVTANTYTTPVLDDDVDYDFRVKAICSTADESGYVTTTEHVECVTQVPGVVGLPIGDGNTTDYTLPFYGNWGYTYSQQIFDASELNNTPTTISSVSFYLTSIPGSTGNIRIWLGHTTKTKFSSNTDYVSPSDLTEVKVINGSYTYTTGWHTITFDTPFEYDGTSNLVLAYYEGLNGYSSGSFRHHSTTDYKAISHYSDSPGYVSYTDPVSGAASSSKNYFKKRNNVIFGVTGMVCQPVVSCPAPSNVAIVNKTENSVTFNWNKGGSETAWTVVYTLGNQEYSVTANDTVYTITGLQGSTQYSIPVQVYANCDATHQSAGVSGTLNFKTPCPAITTFPWNEDFESFPAYSSTSYSATYKLNDQCWLNEHVSGSGTYLFQVTSSTMSGNSTHKLQLPDMSSGTMTKLVLPLMDLPTQYYQFVLDVYRNTNSSSTGEGIRVFVSTNGEIEGATELAFISRNYTVSDNNLIPAESASRWYTYEIPIGVSGPCYIILRGESKYGSATYMDNFEVNAMPTCMKPTNLAYANDTLSWTPTASFAGTPTNFNVRYRVQGDTVWTTATATTSALELNLLSATKYEAQVQSNCGGGDLSDWSALYQFITPCNLLSLPYVQNFESIATGTLPACWEKIGSGTINVQNSTSNAYQSSYYLKFSGSTSNLVALPEFESRNLQMTFYTRPESPSYSSCGTFEVGYVNANNEFTALQTYTYDDFDGYAKKTVNYNLPASARIAFRHLPTSTYYYWYVDNINIDEIPTCTAPDAASFRISSDYTTLTWSPGSIGTPVGYVLQYREAGTEAFTTVNVTNPTYTFTGLTEGTTYEFKVKQDCGATDGQSDWTPILSFRVPRTCPAPIELPFFESFEDTSMTRDCWMIADIDRDGYNWTLNNYSAYAHSGDYFYASPSYYDESALTSDNVLLSPAIHISTPAQLSFWASSLGNWLDHFSVYIDTALQTLFNTTPLLDSVEAPNGYTEYVFNLDAYIGKTIYIAFRHQDYNQNWLLLDDISITTHPSCSAPMALAFEDDTLIWNKGVFGTPASYNVRYRLQGDTTWTTAVVDTNFYAPARWEPNSNYEAQVQTNCGNEDLSEWCDVLQFHTPVVCFTPTNLAVNDVTYYSANVSWTDSHAHGNYAIEYKAEGDTAWTTVAGDSTLKVTLTNLNYLTTYTVRMKSVCSELDESEYSDEVEFTTLCAGGYNSEVDFSFANSQSGYQYLPFYGYYKFTYSQQIYDASELNTGATEITSISFKCSGAPSAAYTGGIHIWLGQTDKSTFANNTDYVDVNTLTEVFAMPETEGYQYVAGEWNTFTFDTPFHYDGTSNLVVAFYEGMDGGSYDKGYFYAHTTTDYKSIYQYDDDREDVSYTNPASAGAEYKSYTSQKRNDIILNMGGQYCPPDTDLAVVSIEPIEDACDLSNAKVTVRVKNNSYLNAVNGFTAILALNDTADVVTETVNATIAPQGSYTFTFAHVPAYADGSNNIKVTVTAADDEVENNNVITLNDIRQVVPATVPYDQDFSNVYLTSDAWKQGTENNNPNLWKNNNGVLTFMDNDTIDAQNYVITHCIEIPAEQVQVSYDYNALSNLPENLNVYMGTTPDISTMTLIGSHEGFTKADEDYTFNYLFNNENEGIYYFAIEARSTKGNMGVTFDNLKIMPMIDVMVSIRPDSHGEDNGIVRPHVGINPIPYNGSLTINMIPNEMYHVAGVWVDSVQVVNEDPYNASFMMYTLDSITEAHTIEVQYKMEFHIFKYVYNYNDQYAEVGGQIVGKPIDTTIIPSGGLVQFTADEHYTLYSMVMGNQPPASEGAIIDGENVTADVTYDEATRTYSYIIDTMYVANYYVQACFKRDTVAINYATLTGEGVYDGVNTHAGETHITYVDYGTDFTSSILPAEGYYTMNVTVNGVDTGIIDHYDFDSVITEQYVTAQFGHKVTASIMNINNNEYLGSDEVRGGIDPAEQMILSGSSCSVHGYVQEHFHLSNFFVNGVDKLADVTFDGLNFSYTIDSLVANTDIVAVVRIDTIAIYYTVDGGNGYVNGNLMEAPALDTLYLDYGSIFMSNFAAATGYHIVNVTVNGTAYNEIPQWLTEYLTEAQYITVTFALNEYDITTTAHGNGSVSEGMHVVFDPESSYTFTATPAVGSHISQILRNNEALEISDPEATYTETISPVLSDYNYVAFFAANIYTVTASCGENGTIDPYGAQSFEYGETPTFTVTPNAGYAIEHVYVDGEEVELTNNAYTFAALTANHTISATFTADNYTITATAGNHGSIDPDGENVVMAGSTVVYTITPATGYEIEDVTVDGQSVGAVSTYTFENVEADHTIAATFSALQFTITATAGANGTITPAGVQTVNYGSTPTFTVAANPGYEIDYVLVDGQNVALTSGAYTFAAVTANHEIFAAFKMKTYTITVTDPANGTITPNGTITVNHGATPTFTVTPATGYNVTAITVNGNNVIASAQATVMGAYTYTFPAVTANRTLTATMTKKQFTITATAGAHGTITGPATVSYGDNATYTIAASEGYEIEDVTVDGMHVGAVATYTFHNVTANHTIVATFKVEPCVVPTNLRTINIDSTSATLVWYHPGADSYDIQYKVSTANTWTVVSNVPGFAYDLTNLQSATNYVWKIKANTVGCTDNDWSNANSFTTLAGPSSPDGINDYVKNHVNVYAEHNRVHIINDYNVDINNVAIYDMYGKLIYSGNAISNPEVIELNVAVGTYVVRLNTQQGPAVYKVHINR